MTGFVEKYGPWAVVTGASKGIGSEFSKQLAAKGLNIVLVARREDATKAVAESIRSKCNVETRVVLADLVNSDGVERVLSETSDIDVGLIVNNAGLEQHGSFFKDDFDVHSNLIAVNVTAVTALAHGFGRRFIKRGKGGIIFISSTGKSPMPWMSSYCASKGFVSNLAYILRHELEKHGVDVTSVEPGVVKTDMTEGDFQNLGWPTVSAEKCAADSIAAFEQKALMVTPGYPIDTDQQDQILSRLDGASEQMQAHWDAKLFEPKV